MTWFKWKMWRLAWAKLDGAIIDRDGRWVHVIGNLCWLVASRHYPHPRP